MYKDVNIIPMIITAVLQPTHSYLSRLLYANQSLLFFQYTAHLNQELI